MNQITKAKERFRKLWSNINKDNQHLTTEKIEDLIESEIKFAHQAGREEARNELRKNIGVIGAMYEIYGVGALENQQFFKEIMQCVENVTSSN